MGASSASTESASAADPSPVSLLFNFSAVLGVESRVSYVYSAPKPLLLGSALLRARASCVESGKEVVLTRPMKRMHAYTLTRKMCSLQTS